MARHDIEILHIDDDHRPLVAAVEALASDGEGWMNVEPGVDDEDRVEPPGMFTWFTARGPKVPVGTFVPGSDREPASVGLSHGAGRDAVERLVDAAVAPPTDWVARQNHPKRGLVWEIHPQRVDAGAVVRLLLEGTVVLATVPTTGGWVATIHRSRR
mgnify:FL=1